MHGFDAAAVLPQSDEAQKCLKPQRLSAISPDAHASRKRLCTCQQEPAISERIDFLAKLSSVDKASRNSPL
jgi:hypothetical protein